MESKINSHIEQTKYFLSYLMKKYIVEKKKTKFLFDESTSTKTKVHQIRPSFYWKEEVTIDVKII